MSCVAEVYDRTKEPDQQDVLLKKKSRGKHKATLNDNNERPPQEVVHTPVSSEKMVKRMVKHVTEQLQLPAASAAGEDEETEDTFEDEVLVLRLLRRIMGRWREANDTNKDATKKLVSH